MLISTSIFIIGFGGIPCQFWSCIALLQQVICRNLGDGGNINCGISEWCCRAIWSLPLVNVNMSVAHRNNSEAIFCSDMENDCWLWIHSISNPLHIRTSIFSSWHMGSYLCVWNCPMLDLLSPQPCNWMLIDQSELSSQPQAPICFQWFKNSKVTVTHHRSSSLN